MILKDESASTRNQPTFLQIPPMNRIKADGARAETIPNKTPIAEIYCLN